MPTVFEQTCLKPGRYVVNGQPRDFTRADLELRARNTKQVLAAGHSIPVLFEHATPGSDEGAPKNPRDARAAAVKNGAGWLKDVKVNERGELVHRLEVTDPVAAEKLAAGSIRFTSPEFRRGWRDGQGREFNDFISHVALTHVPRATDQGPIKPVDGVEQFSLADLCEEVTQMSDGTDGNPDMPKGADKSAEKLTAVLEHLKTLGAALPADTSSENFLDRLLTALLTLEAKKMTDDATKATEEKDADSKLREEQPMQFSLGAVEAKDFGQKLLARVVKQEHKSLTDRLDSLVKDGRITPAMRDGLRKNESDLQFSADGDYLPAFTLPQIVDLLEQSTLPHQATSDDQFSLAVASHEHPDPNWGADATGAKPLTAEQAKAKGDELAKKYPGLYT